MVGYFSLSVPSGLGLYWITNNLVTTSISLAVKERFKRDPIVMDVEVSGVVPSGTHQSRRRTGRGGNLVICDINSRAGYSKWIDVQVHQAGRKAVRVQADGRPLRPCPA